MLRYDPPLQTSREKSTFSHAEALTTYHLQCGSQLSLTNISLVQYCDNFIYHIYKVECCLYTHRLKSKMNDEASKITASLENCLDVLRTFL